jgi:hypothetical protein
MGTKEIPAAAPASAVWTKCPPGCPEANYVVEEDPIPCSVVGGESGIITASVEELL